MRTNDVDVRVGSGGIVIVVAEGEGSSVLIIESSLGADAPETPRSVDPIECRG